MKKKLTYPKIKCPDCNVKMVEGKILVRFDTNPHGFLMEEAKGLICEKCGRQLVPEEECNRLFEKVKKVKRTEIGKKAKLIVF